MKEIRIGHHLIGKGQKPFVIAEMSGNHNQSLEQAMAIIDAAAEAGADAIKLQTYTADTITMKGAYKINDPASLWAGKELYDLYKLAYTPWEWHAALFERAQQRGILAFSSPFDESAVDFLETLNVPCYKIASFENTDWLLLRKVARTGKPVIMSSGGANLDDLTSSVRVLRENGCKDLILLKCTSNYPSSPASSNLATIPYLEEIFQCNAGISDHTLGIGVSIGAVALGAKVIEKHFTLNRSDGGVDSVFSLEPPELKMLVEESKKAFLAVGQVQLSVGEEEKKGLAFKRSLYVSVALKKGDVFSKENIRSIRPALGLHTRHYDSILGKVAKTDIAVGTPLSWDLIQ
jgi:pseudaminic acid synthase